MISKWERGEKRPSRLYRQLLCLFFGTSLEELGLGTAARMSSSEITPVSDVPWTDPQTHASGLRVPGPLGDRLILRAIRESRGSAAAVSEEVIAQDTLRLSRETGIDATPEGGCALGVLEKLVRARVVTRDAEVVLFNTGSGASYRF